MGTHFNVLQLPSKNNGPYSLPFSAVASSGGSNLSIFSRGKRKRREKKKENTELVRVVWALGDHLGVLVYVLILDDVMFGLILERYRVFPCMGDSHVVSAYMILPVLEKFASSI